MKAIRLNVSELEAPQPMVEILTALASLPCAHYLEVTHRKEPYPLFPKLTANGWCYQCDEITTEEFHIYIFRASDEKKFRRLNKY